MKSNIATDTKKINRVQDPVIPRQPTPAKQLFNAASRIIGAVGLFGEEFCTTLLGGEIVSNDADFALFADIYHQREKLAVQVRMSNGRHAHRPTVYQVKMLYKEVTQLSFVYPVTKGIYALVFYGGVDETKNGKSMIMSRKLDKVHGRRIVLAQELQYVYLIDALLMEHFATDPQFQNVRKKGKQRVWDRYKIARGNDKEVLYLNRTFLRAFMEKVLRYQYVEALERVFGRKKWRIKERTLSIDFVLSTAPHADEVIVRKSLPIRMIGGRKTIRTLNKLLKESKRKKIMRLD